MILKIAIFVLFELFERFCFYAPSSLLLRIIHVLSRIAYYILSLYLLKSMMENHCKGKESHQWYMGVFYTLKSLFTLRLYQTLGYFLSNIWFMSISEVFYDSMRMMTRFWKIYYIFGYSDKIQIFKQALYFMLGHVLRYFVCFITWIEYDKPSDEIQVYRYRLYNCMVIISYLVLIVIELLKI